MFNLVIVLILTFAVAFVLIYFIASHDRKLKIKLDHEHPSDPLDVETDFRRFTKFCMELCEYLKLEISDVTRPQSDEVVIRAANVNPITRVEYLIVGFYVAPHVEIAPTKIMEVSDQIVSERLSKGILITPGFFPESAKCLPELAPMEFIDGTKMNEMKGKIIL